MGKILVEISARHVHLSEKIFNILFGKKAKLEKIRELSQPDEFVSDKRISLETEKGVIEKIRVVGPLRSETQLELSQTDARFLGIDPPIRVSGNLKGSEKGILIGSYGSIELSKGIIIAQRHLHLDPQTAKKEKLENGDLVSVKIDSQKRSLTFHNVVARVSQNYRPVCHIDTDEGNAAGIKEIGEGLIIKKND